MSRIDSIIKNIRTTARVLNMIQTIYLIAPQPHTPNPLGQTTAQEAAGFYGLCEEET